MKRPRIPGWMIDKDALAFRAALLSAALAAPDGRVSQLNSTEVGLIECKTTLASTPPRAVSGGWS